MQKLVLRLTQLGGPFLPRIYLYLALKSQKSGTVWVYQNTMDFIASEVGCSRRTVLAKIHLLEKLELIYTKRERYGSTWIFPYNIHKIIQLQPNQRVTPFLSHLEKFSSQVHIQQRVTPFLSHLDEEEGQLLLNQLLSKIESIYNNTMLTGEKVLTGDTVLTGGVVLTKGVVLTGDVMPPLEKAADFMETPEQLDLISVPRAPNCAPKLPASAKTVAEQENEFPYKRASLQTSALWYWAIERYRKHCLDIDINTNNSKQMLKKYRNVKRVLDTTDWAVHKNYIDWFISSYDAFIRNRTQYAFEVLCTSKIINKWMNTHFNKEDHTIIETDEERVKYQGKRVQDDSVDKPVAVSGKWIKH